MDGILELESSSPLVKEPGRGLCGFLGPGSLFAPIKSLLAPLDLGSEEQLSSRSAREMRAARFEPSSSSDMKAAALWLCISQRGCSVLYMLIPTVSYHCVGAKCGDPSPSSSIIPHTDAHLHGHTHTHTHRAFALPSSASGNERPSPWAFPRNLQLAARTGGGIATAVT